MDSSDGNYAQSSVMSDRFINFVRSKIFKNKEMTDSFQQEKKITMIINECLLKYQKIKDITWSDKLSKTGKHL